MKLMDMLNKKITSVEFRKGEMGQENEYTEIMLVLEDGTKVDFFGNTDGYIMMEVIQSKQCKLCKGRGVIDRPVICGPHTSEEEMRRLSGEPISCPSCKGQKKKS